MKKTFSLILIGAAAFALQSCSGDHSTTSGDDSVRQIPNYDAKALTLDTFSVTTHTGSASILENYSSGGQTTVKDTMKHTYYTGKPAAAAPAAAPADTAKKDTTAKK